MRSQLMWDTKFTFLIQLKSTCDWAAFTLKATNRNCSWRHFNFLHLSFEENKAWFFMWILCKQRIHLKHQVLFSLKNNEKIFMNVVCCSRDWHFKGWRSLSAFSQYNHITASAKSCIDSYGSMSKARMHKQILQLHRQTYTSAVDKMIFQNAKTPISIITYHPPQNSLTFPWHFAVFHTL